MFAGRKNSCCNQVLTTDTFMSKQTKRTFDVFFNINCKREYVIYPMECILCKTQYVGKAGKAFKLTLNNRRKTTRNLTPFWSGSIFKNKDIISTNMPDSSSLTNW